MSDLFNEIKNMKQATITVSQDRTMVTANTENSVYQLYNEGITKGPIREDGWPMRPGIWYKIDGDFGHWVLKNEFPTTKGDEFINVIYLEG